jgi:hypothetical protein
MTREFCLPYGLQDISNALIIFHKKQDIFDEYQETAR